MSLSICEGGDFPNKVFAEIFEWIKNDPISLKEDDNAHKSAGIGKGGKNAASVSTNDHGKNCVPRLNYFCSQGDPPCRHPISKKAGLKELLLYCPLVVGNGGGADNYGCSPESGQLDHHSQQQLQQYHWREQFSGRRELFHDQQCPSLRGGLRYQKGQGVGAHYARKYD